ncbi:hypothetical protein AXG93_625s1220 [Marchantia polymorpha subsp. ruderalis]|uniref:Uncharacterized protein n=1 Tax=Marchantia polymorpha subsp. ruderalis TaxID=1480154 RepID=A0A176VDR8_MARPO|nr:hypothetical protein AXG93_625s1220 [Marchantia polymorpha subsp. ruderalis]
MDSAHEEPELPSAIQDLLQLLEGQGEPITELPEFPRRASLSTIIGTQSQVRLRVLEAIGSCKTLEILDVRHICGGDISMLTASEWEVVLRGFRSSTVLKKINVDYRSRDSDDAENESFCFQLGRILNSSSVTELSVCNLLSARGFLNLASGLRGHPDSKLKSLDLLNVWEDSSAVKYMVDMINSAPQLETLRLGHWDDMEDETVGILSQALIQSSSLKELTLEAAGKWGGPLLLKALAGDDRNRSIERLRLRDMVGLGDCLRELLISNPSLKEVQFHTFDMRPEQFHQLGEAIRDNAIATTILVLAMSGFRYDDWKSIEALACSSSSDVKDPTVELHLESASSDQHWMLSLNLLGRVLRGEIRSLKSLRILAGGKEVITFSTFSMNGEIGETSVLKRLELSVRSEDLSEAVWEDMLRCMRGNHLTHLDLSDSELNEEAFRDVMGVLQVNLALQEIDVSRTSWATDGKAAQIQEALKQNQKRAVYMSVFREANLTFGDAKAGRLFLCGSPKAGKTQLRKTLMRINHSWLHRSRLFNKWNILRRTRGIEVEFLQNNDKMQISVWDLAGQWMFRTLQNVLFSQTNNFCVFLFVYSPFCEETSSNKPDSCFETELEDWLSFITSSIKVTGRDLPQVFVVISHKDKARYSSLSWAQSIFEKLTQRFANFVDLRPVQEWFHVDARSKKQVIPLNNHIFENFNKLLREKSPQVPKLCSQLTSLLVIETKKKRSFPLWPSQFFYEFCAPSLTQFIPSSYAHSVDHSRIMESIISYLNDIGYIIYIPNLNYIIVNPNWLTNTFLGELIALGQDFQAQESKSSIRTSSYSSMDGFVSESVFARLIEEFLEKQPHGQRGVEREELENILVNLDLCFKLEDTSQYFIPSFIPEHASKEDQKHQEEAHLESMYWENRSETSQFVGIRIQCQDERTMSLTAAFFPRFQELISFSASPKGCPGVALVLGVIQTFCVEMLIPSHLRGAILVEKLKSDFICSINDKLEGMPLERLQLMEKKELFDYEHCWRPIKSHTGGRSERARDLLWESDVEAAVNEIRQKRIEELKSLQEGLISVDNDLAQCYPEAENMVSDLNFPPMKDPKPLTSRCLSRASTSVENASVETQLVLFKMDQLEEKLVQKVDGLDERLRSVHSILQRMEMKMEQILSLHQELQSMLSAFVFKVDRIIQYSDSLEQARMPKRPYVTTDVGLFYRMSALLHDGTTVRLQLMCESVTGIHTIKDQEGLKIRLDRENSSCIRKTIEISYKVMYYAVKAGLDKTLNLGQAIPDWEDLKSDIVQLDGISDDDHRAFLKGGESKELQEAWLRIHQTLAPQLQNRYSKIFKLYQVKYVSSEKGGHAWVCEKCMNKGLRCGILTC